MLLGIALLGALGQQGIWKNTIGPEIQHRVLPQVWEGINATVERIFERGGSVLLVFASVLAIWDVSGAVRACMSGLNEILGTRDDRPTWRRFATSMGLAVTTILCLVGAALVLTIGQHLERRVGGVAAVPLEVGRWVGTVLLLGLGVGLVVHLAPCRSVSKTWASAGTAVIVAAWLVTSLVFRWFVTSVANYHTGPGTLAAFLVLTTYIYASAIIFMVGVQLDELLQDDQA